MATLSEEDLEEIANMTSQTSLGFDRPVSRSSVPRGESDFNNYHFVEADREGILSAQEGIHIAYGRHL